MLVQVYSVARSFGVKESKVGCRGSICDEEKGREGWEWCGVRGKVDIDKLEESTGRKRWLTKEEAKEIIATANWMGKTNLNCLYIFLF